MFVIIFLALSVDNVYSSVIYIIHFSDKIFES